VAGHRLRGRDQLLLLHRVTSDLLHARRLQLSLLRPLRLQLEHGDEQADHAGRLDLAHRLHFLAVVAHLVLQEIDEGIEEKEPDEPAPAGPHLQPAADEREPVSELECRLRLVQLV